MKKLSEDHYIVMDDSEIKEGDWYYDSNDVESLIPIYQRSQQFADYSGCKKITRSTQPIEYEVVDVTPTGDAIEGYVYDKIQELSLSEVKELLGEVDVEKKADEEYYEQDKSFENDIDPFLNYSEYLKVGFIDGYNQALEDNKEKKWTDADVIRIVEKSRQTGLTAEYLMLSLQPQTEWEVEFIDGKLKLKQ